MTRFVSLSLADLECGGVNRETERLFAYHHGTNHSYRAVWTNAHFLDWHHQTDPDPRLMRLWFVKMTTRRGAEESATSRSTFTDGILPIQGM